MWKYVEEARRKVVTSNASFSAVLCSISYVVMLTTDGLLFHPPKTNKL